jgi:hypothetical protein
MNGKLLRVHIDGDDRWDGAPLYEAVVERCRAMGIAGATVLSGVEGFGETGHIHRRRRELPLVVLVVDSVENIERVIPYIEQMVPTGVIAISDVEVIRVERSSN